MKINPTPPSLARATILSALRAEISGAVAKGALHPNSRVRLSSGSCAIVLARAYEGCDDDGVLDRPRPETAVAIVRVLIVANYLGETESDGYNLTEDAEEISYRVVFK